MVGSAGKRGRLKLPEGQRGSRLKAREVGSTGTRGWVESVRMPDRLKPLAGQTDGKRLKAMGIENHGRVLHRRHCAGHKSSGAVPQCVVYAANDTARMKWGERHDR